jgi:hypothetical protein
MAAGSVPTRVGVPTALVATVIGMIVPGGEARLEHRVEQEDGPAVRGYHDPADVGAFRRVQHDRPAGRVSGGADRGHRASPRSAAVAGHVDGLAVRGDRDQASVRLDRLAGGAAGGADRDDAEAARD